MKSDGAMKSDRFGTLSAQDDTPDALMSPPTHRWMRFRLWGGRKPEPWPRRRASPLTFKILAFNLTAILLLVVGILALSPQMRGPERSGQDAVDREAILYARLVAEKLETVATGAGLDVLPLFPGDWVGLFSPSGQIIAQAQGPSLPVPNAPKSLWDGVMDHLCALVAVLCYPTLDDVRIDGGQFRLMLVDEAKKSGFFKIQTQSPEGGMMTAISQRIDGPKGEMVFIVMRAEPSQDAIKMHERTGIMRIFVVAIIVSIGLSLALASAISHPLAELAMAAEAGQTRPGHKRTTSRIVIPDFSGRHDEIGRLSVAIRRMVNALYDRIDSNERFAADVAHEIKNPLASLRSAAASLTRVTQEHQRQELITIIDKDVARLDRLVSDISNASRLDRDLVQSEQSCFDIVALLRQIAIHYQAEAKAQSVALNIDLPSVPVMITGLEDRLAQVFVNLISNALSFSSPGDTVFVRAHQRGKRLLVIVEDRGPGIPLESLTRIFQRFYSYRKDGQFGEHSGLGLAISKQIVEAHGGVIWAENILPPGLVEPSPPIGARFVVGVPV